MVWFLVGALIALVQCWFRWRHDFRVAASPLGNRLGGYAVAAVLGSAIYGGLLWAVLG